MGCCGLGRGNVFLGVGASAQYHGVVDMGRLSDMAVQWHLVSFLGHGLSRVVAAASTASVLDLGLDLLTLVDGTHLLAMPQLIPLAISGDPAHPVCVGCLGAHLAIRRPLGRDPASAGKLVGDVDAHLDDDDAVVGEAGCDVDETCSPLIEFGRCWCGMENRRRSMPDFDSAIAYRLCSTP